MSCSCKILKDNWTDSHHPCGWWGDDHPQGRQTRGQSKGASVSKTQQLQPHWRKRCVFLYFEEKEGVGINIKAEMKGSTLTESPRGSMQIMAQEYPLLPALCNSSMCLHKVLYESDFAPPWEIYLPPLHPQGFLHDWPRVEPGHQWFLNAPQVQLELRISFKWDILSLATNLKSRLGVL